MIGLIPVCAETVLLKVGPDVHFPRESIGQYKLTKVGAIQGMELFNCGARTDKEATAESPLYSVKGDVLYRPASWHMKTVLEAELGDHVEICCCILLVNDMEDTEIDPGEGLYEGI